MPGKKCVSKTFQEVNDTSQKFFYTFFSIEIFTKWNETNVSHYNDM